MLNRKEAKEVLIKLFWIIVACAILILLTNLSYAGEVDDLLCVISRAESSGGKFLSGDGGKSLDAYHICAAVVIDYNRANGAAYKHTDLLTGSINEKIARWHVRRIIRLLKRKGIYSRAKVIQVWNVGFAALKRPLPKKHRNLVYNKIYAEVVCR